MSHTNAHYRLAGLGIHVNIPDLAFDEAGVCKLSFDDIQLTIETEPSGESLLIYSDLGPMNTGAQTDMAERLLEANLFGQGTGGATLSLERQTGHVVLCQSIRAAAVSDPQFRQMVEVFVAAAEKWIAVLRGDAPQNSNPISPNADWLVL